MIGLLKIRNGISGFYRKKEGMGTIEVVIIVAVLVALALLFKDFIIGLAQDIFDDIQAKTSSSLSKL